MNATTIILIILGLMLMVTLVISYMSMHELNQNNISTSKKYAYASMAAQALSLVGALIALGVYASST